MVAAGVAAWYIYAGYYNSVHGGKYTFNSIWPVWWSSGKYISENYLLMLRKVVLMQVFSPIMWLVLCAAGIFFLLWFHRFSPFCQWMNLTGFAGLTAYSILWSAAFDVHDYYFINTLIIYFGLLISVALHLRVHYTEILQNHKLRIVLVLFLIYSVAYTSNNLNMRYFPDQKKKYLLAGSRYEAGYFKWFGREYPRTREAFETITPYLRSIGVSSSDKVISLPDPSFNVTLYLMNNKGWTSMGASDDEGEYIRRCITHGARFLIISDSTLLNFEYIKPFIREPIGQWKNIGIYRLPRLIP